MNLTSQDVQTLLDQYVAWIKDRTVLREIPDQWFEITTPHLDRHNDYLQIFVKKKEGHILLSDGGYIIDDLIMSGCNLDSPKRKELLATTLAGFGIQQREGQLEVHADPDTFPLRKHNLVQAMLAVNDLFYLADPVVRRVFLEDVESWLDENDVRYSSNVKFTGKTGYDHLFHFLIPKSKSQPERLLQAISRPSKDTAESAIMKWIDTKEVRPPNARAYAILNDTEQKVPSGVREALASYEIYPILWSDRELAREELAA